MSTNNDSDGSREHGDEKSEELASLAMLLFVESMLNQFAHTKVRADLINGKFSSINPNILDRLDELRGSLFPRWQTMDNSIKRYTAAALKVKNLMNQETDILILNSDNPGDSWTYKKWFDVLEKLGVKK